MMAAFKLHYAPRVTRNNEVAFACWIEEKDKGGDEAEAAKQWNQIGRGFCKVEARTNLFARLLNETHLSIQQIWSIPDSLKGRENIEGSSETKN
jgi:hypothetical protein